MTRHGRFRRPLSVLAATDYNALVARRRRPRWAKGDQHTALTWLLAARSQLRSCEERDNDSATGAVAIALNSPRLGLLPPRRHFHFDSLESDLHQTRARLHRLASSLDYLLSALMRSISWSIS